MSVSGPTSKRLDKSVPAHIRRLSPGGVLICDIQTDHDSARIKLEFTSSLFSERSLYKNIRTTDNTGSVSRTKISEYFPKARAMIPQQLQTARLMVTRPGPSQTRLWSSPLSLPRR